MDFVVRATSGGRGLPAPVARVGHVHSSLPAGRLAASRHGSGDWRNLADAHGSGPCERKLIGVQIPGPPPLLFRGDYSSVLEDLDLPVISTVAAAVASAIANPVPSAV
jgi:hypothetical protein